MLVAIRVEGLGFRVVEGLGGLERNAAAVILICFCLAGKEDMEQHGRYCDILGSLIGAARRIRSFIPCEPKVRF